MTATASNTAKSAEVLPFPSDNIEAHHASILAEIDARWIASERVTVESMVEAGEALRQAKEGENKVPHGRFSVWCKDHVPWSESKIKALITIAKHPVLSNRLRGGDLPASYRTLEVLARYDDEALTAAIARGDVHREIQRDEASELKLPLKRKASGSGAPSRVTDQVSLTEWKKLASDERREFLQPHNFPGQARFNKQGTHLGIEWGQWSWNPVTGCLHNCPYCYARDIAERFNSAYPHGFEPAFRPDHLNAPGLTEVPPEAGADTRYRNVFTCSMADLFGRWVPREWIEAVLGVIAENPQWNFLCLTKFPKRMAEFDIPPNAWMGTTVDLQARVPAAEAAFVKVGSGVKWLSVEPLLEPLKFNRLDLFDWIVIGGASKSAQTPEWRPPFAWIADLVAQADAAGVRVYFKSNLLGNRRLELPFDAPIIGDPTQAPEVFNYLGRKDAA